VGTVTVSRFEVALVTVAERPPIVTVFRAGVVLKPVPRRVAVEPSTRVSGDTESRNGGDVTLGTVGSARLESPLEHPATTPMLAKRRLGRVRRPIHPPGMKSGHKAESPLQVRIGGMAAEKAQNQNQNKEANMGGLLSKGIGGTGHTLRRPRPLAVTQASPDRGTLLGGPRLPGF